MRRNVAGRFATNVSSWRRMAVASWRPANDPTIYGTFAVDVTRALAFLRRDDMREHHVTITHLVAKAVANTFALHPECNAYIRRGRVFLRDDVDVFVLVAVPPADTAVTAQNLRVDLTGVKVARADRKRVADIADEIASGARRARAGDDAELGPIKGLMDALPAWLLRPALALTAFAQYELNLDLSNLGIPRDTFGGVFVTSLGMLGIQHGFPPVVPMTRLAANLAVGQVQDTPVVENGQIVVRPMLPLTATFDHRVIDGYQAAKLAQTFTRILADPAAHLD